MFSDKILKQFAEREMSLQALGELKKSVVSSQDDLSEIFPRNWVIDIPCDESSVGGDFLFVKSVEDKHIFAVIDGIGHSLQGMAAALAIQVVISTAIDFGITDPSDIIMYMHRKIVQYLKSGVTCDLALIKKVDGSDQISYAGAKRSLYHKSGEELYLFTPSRISIGQHRGDRIQVKTRTVNVESGDRIYMATDGVESQLGRNEKPLGKRKFRNWLAESGSLPMGDQMKDVINRVNKWCGNRPLVDDILVVALEI